MYVWVLRQSQFKDKCNVIGCPVYIFSMQKRFWNNFVHLSIVMRRVDKVPKSRIDTTLVKCQLFGQNVYGHYIWNTWRYSDLFNHKPYQYDHLYLFNLLTYVLHVVIRYLLIMAVSSEVKVFDKIIRETVHCLPLGYHLAYLYLLV